MEFCARVSDDDASTWPVGIDGCGIPVYATSLRNAARSFARLASLDSSQAGDAEALQTVRDAMVAHPEYVAGTGQLDTELMTAADGSLVAKAGAEGVHGVAAIEPATGYVSKVLDGSCRARGPSTIAVLRSLGALDARTAAKLARFATPPVYNRAGMRSAKSACLHTSPSKKRVKRVSEYLRLLGERVLIFDGAMGTQLMELDLSADDFGGLSYRGCNEALVLTRPDVVRAIHESYLAAGADVVETDSFTGIAVEARRVRTGRKNAPRSIGARQRSRARPATRSQRRNARASSRARWDRPGC